MIRTLFLVLALLAVTVIAAPARADDVTEASALFERGNGHFQSGMRTRGTRRTRELEAALDDYFASLRLVRSRNVLYNTALVLEQLERWDDGFNYWTEYVGVAGLSAEELADGQTHRDALRPRVAVASIESDPSRAEVWIDRRDLAVRGTTPLEIALPAGEHALWLVRAGWDETEGRVTAVLGTTTTLRVALTARPVMVQVLAPDARLLLDGVAIDAGTSVAVAPGAHVLSLEIDGRPAIERRFEVVPDSAPMVIDLTTAVAALVGRESGPGTATLRVTSTVAARVLLDGVMVGSGERLELPVAPGTHEVGVEPSSGATWRGSREFVAGEVEQLSIDARGTSGGLRAGRAVTGTLSILGLLGAGGLSLVAGLAGNDYATGPTQAGFDYVTTLNLAADVSWGVTAALGITAIILLAVDDAGTDGHFSDTSDGEGE